MRVSLSGPVRPFELPAISTRTARRRTIYIPSPQLGNKQYYSAEAVTGREGGCPWYQNTNPPPSSRPPAFQLRAPRKHLSLDRVRFVRLTRFKDTIDRYRSLIGVHEGLRSPTRVLRVMYPARVRSPFFSPCWHDVASTKQHNSRIVHLHYTI